MQSSHIDDALKSLEKANTELEVELLSAHTARALLASYARAEKLAAFGKTVLASKLDDPTELARVTGTAVSTAKTTVDTARALGDADELRDAFRGGTISLDQASEIARAEQARPGAASELLPVASGEAFQVLRDRAKGIVLDAAKGSGLAARQHDARSARTSCDELGMIHFHLALEPHVGAPLARRAETEAARLYRKARKDRRPEPFERHLADAYAGLLADGSTGRPSRRPELVVVVSHGVAARGWKDVASSEVCKIPGIGPVAPAVAKKIAADAFLTGVFYDGTDLRHIRRWTRNTPIEVLVALELGDPPGFDGIRCADCGNRFGTQNDHLEPHNTGAPASLDNLEPRCFSCHAAKTERDRKAGKLTPRSPATRRGPPRP